MELTIESQIPIPARRLAGGEIQTMDPIKVFPSPAAAAYEPGDVVARGWLRPFRKEAGSDIGCLYRLNSAPRERYVELRATQETGRDVRWFEPSSPVPNPMMYGYVWTEGYFSSKVAVRVVEVEVPTAEGAS